MTLSSEPRLGDLLRLALERSPRIQAARERALAAEESAAAEAWLPSPMLTLGWYETPIQTRVGAQDFSVGISQAIPFPTKLSARADAEDADARRVRVAYERIVRDVLVEVVRTAHELEYLHEAEAITAEVAALLERYVVLSAEEDGDVRLSELFRAETQRAQLDNDRVILRELRVAEEEHLRSLLALPRDVSVGRPRTGALPRVAAAFDDLLRIAERHNQEVIEAGLALEAASVRADLAGQSHVPDLRIGATRIYTDRLDRSLGMDPDGNGNDALILQLGISIPLWAQRDAAVHRRARFLERAASYDRVEAVQRLRDRLARTWFAVGNAERLHRLYAEVLVPRARAAARTAEDLLAAGKGSVAGALETIAVLHNFRLAAARARADRGRSLADLERALGRPLERTERGNGNEEER